MWYIFVFPNESLIVRVTRGGGYASWRASVGYLLLGSTNEFWLELC